MSENLKKSAYAFAGFAMMLNIRLVYSASPYALMRFKLPENLFSVFVRVMASSLELWCLPSMTIGNILDFIRKRIAGDPDSAMETLFRYQSIFWSWANFATFGILWIVYVMGGDQGNVTAFYWVIAASGFVFGINMVLVYALEFWYLPYYMVGENSFPMVTSLMHYVSTSIFGNRRKYDSDYIVVYIDIVISLAISLVAAVLWTIAYKDKAGFPPKDKNQKDCVTLKVEPNPATSATSVTYTVGTDFDNKDIFKAHTEATNGDNCKYQGPEYYAHLVPPSLMVLVGMGLVYTIYPGIAPGMIVPFYLVDKIEMVLLIATAFPPVIIKILPEIDQRTNPYVLKGSWGVYHKPICKSGNPERKGCTEYTEKITKVKLAITPSNTHTITLTPSGSGNSGTTSNVSTSKTVSLAGSGANGTLTIKLPGGEIKLTQLTISSTSLTITGGTSRVSVIKKPNPWGPGEQIKLQSATLTSSGNQLSITKEDTNGEDEAIIGGGGQSVELNFSSSGTSEITIDGSAITELGAKFIDQTEIHDSHKTTVVCMARYMSGQMNLLVQSGGIYLIFLYHFRSV